MINSFLRPPRIIWVSYLITSLVIDTDLLNSFHQIETFPNMKTFLPSQQYILSKHRTNTSPGTVFDIFAGKCQIHFASKDRR